MGFVARFLSCSEREISDRNILVHTSRIRSFATLRPKKIHS